MKKILIASTALVAAGLITTSAASASEKVNLQLGGFSKWWAVGAWQDKKYLEAKNENYNNVDVKGDNEVHFKGETKLDNGIKVGVQIELEAGGHTDQTSDTIDASFAYVEGGFGKVIVGTLQNGTYLLHVNAPDAAGNWGEGGIMTGGYAIVQPKQVTSITPGAQWNTTAIATGDKTDKITYVAPTFYGLTVGGSYIPNLQEDNRSATDLNVAVAKDNGGANALYQGQAYGVGALYANTFGGVGLKVSGGWVTYDVAAGTGQSQEWSAGSQVSYAGFTLGGSYRHVSLNRKENEGGNNLSAVLPTVNLNTGYAYDIGLQYASGPYAVSASYFHSATDGLTGANQDGQDKIDMYQVSAKYALGAGVDVLASGGYAKFRDGDSAKATNEDKNNAGWTVMSGLSLAF